MRGFVCPSVHPSVGWSVGEHESKSGKTSVSAPAHPSATGIGRVSGLVFLMLATTEVHLLQFTNKPYESRNIRQYQAHLFPRMTNPDLDILGSCP